MFTKHLANYSSGFCCCLHCLFSKAERGQVHSLVGADGNDHSASAVGSRGKEPSTTIHLRVFEITDSHLDSGILKPDQVRTSEEMHGAQLTGIT